MGLILWEGLSLWLFVFLFLCFGTWLAGTVFLVHWSKRRFSTAATVLLLLTVGMSCYVLLVPVGHDFSPDGVSTAKFVGLSIALWLVNPAVCALGLARLMAFRRPALVLATIIACIPSMIFLNACLFPATELAVRRHTLAMSIEHEVRVALFSDLHIGHFLSPYVLERLVAEIENGKPAAILIAGDIVDHRWRDLLSYESFFRQLVSLAPTYAVLGNHDAIAGLEGVEATLKSFGVNVLRDQRCKLNAEIDLIGLRGLCHEKPQYSDIPSPLNARMRTFVLMHHPDTLLQRPLPARLTADCAFAGHTHGGQIRVAGHLLLGQSGRHYACGMNDGPRHCPTLLATAGIGLVGLPLRLGVPPELVFIDCQPASSSR